MPKVLDREFSLDDHHADSTRGEASTIAQFQVHFQMRHTHERVYLILRCFRDSSRPVTSIWGQCRNLKRLRRTLDQVKLLKGTGNSRTIYMVWTRRAEARGAN